MSLSKNNLKLITSLQQKKYRQQHELFVVEGVKVVNEFLQSAFVLEKLFCTEDFSTTTEAEKTIYISENELKKISNLKSPNKVVALFRFPEKASPKTTGLLVALDAVNDPGNLGTIIRLCDWFGITQLVCSLNTVDCFNSKVVQASMGSLTRVAVNYVDLPKFLSEVNLPVFAADMNGENVYKTQLPKEGVLVMGNEANGISAQVKECVNSVISIPRFGDVQKTESLNVATATAILLSEFKR